MGDRGDVGVGRVGVRGVKGVKRLSDDEGDVDEDDNDKGDNDKGDVDKGDDKDENDDVEGDDEVGVGRGRIRRALCAEDTVYGCVIGGTAGKARARCGDVAFSIDEKLGNVLPSILAGKSPLADLWRAPRGWIVKGALSLL
jgi:hypothetical protein